MERKFLKQRKNDYKNKKTFSPELIMIEKKVHKEIYVFAGISIVFILGLCIYLFLAHKNKYYPFDEYKRILDKNSTLTELIPGAVPVPLTPQQLKTRDAHFA